MPQEMRHELAAAGAAEAGEAAGAASEVRVEEAAVVVAAAPVSVVSVVPWALTATAKAKRVARVLNCIVDVRG
jgi:hypothetical protein